MWCRARWVLPASAGAGASGSRTSEGYINLAGVSGLSPVRDTSTCTFSPLSEVVSHISDAFSSSIDYHGPRRGQRYYGYQDYRE